MPSTTMPTTNRERIGSFQSLDGAAQAVSHLVELRYDPEDVAIAPKGFEVVSCHRLRDRLRRAASRAALASAALAGAVATVGAIGVHTLVESTLPIVAAAAALGAAVGIVIAVAQHRRTSWLGDARPVLRPTTFDVVVDQNGARAGHDLARWWDPAAPPAVIQGPAAVRSAPSRRGC
jgi:hypothetical protein